MPTPHPLHLATWIDQNRARFTELTGTQIVWSDRELLVMVIRGPNSRLDFHHDAGDEFFYQLQGDIQLHLMHPEGRREIVTIHEGEIFVCPGGLPHSPRRPPDTYGLVIERRRRPDERDRFLWYCERCNTLVHQAAVESDDVAGEVRAIQEAFNASPELRTCRRCGYQYPAAPVAARLSFL